jgi:hypothetical protein
MDVFFISGKFLVSYVMDEIDFQFLAEHIVDMVCEVGSDLMMSYASPSCWPGLGRNEVRSIANWRH